MKVLISGATGFIGSKLTGLIQAEGHAVCPLSRRPGKNTVVWDPARDFLEAGALDGFDAVVHLAGENIAGRWTASKKRAIRDSRVRGTRLLAAACAAATPPPSVFIMASAVGMYGDRGEETLTEESPPGAGFLPEVCREWEAAAAPADEHPGVRVVKLRLGVVLAPDGGALKKMLPAFRLGGGGRIGSGKQWMSWISRDDAVRIIHRALTDESMRGVYNVVSPEPVRNAEFAGTLGKALRRPALLPVPGFALRLIFGDMADEALLASQRVMPARLTAEGFAFKDEKLEPTLREML